MSRYFITTVNGVEVDDDEGVELPNRAALRMMLRQTLTAILHDEAEADGMNEFTAQAYDEAGRLVMSARASFSATDQ